MTIALFGYSGSGKTTFFQALTGKKIKDFSSRESNIGQAKIKDSRLDELSSILHPKKVTYPEITLIDLKGYPKEKGFSSEVIDQLSKVDLIIFFIDAFSENATPEKDLESLKLELAFYGENMVNKIKGIPFYNQGSFSEEVLKKFFKEVISSPNIIFYTVVGKETRGWLIEDNATALNAAYKIHTDIGSGFIRAEVINFDDFKKAGSLPRAKEMKLVHLEEKDYLIKDGDIITFLFSRP